MPTFDFRCRKCEATFEFSRPFGDSSMPACPSCGSKRTEKLLTPPAIQFKGSGFYKTDSAKSARTKKEKTEKSPEAPKPQETKKEQTPH